VCVSALTILIYDISVVSRVDTKVIIIISRQRLPLSVGGKYASRADVTPPAKISQTISNGLINGL